MATMNAGATLRSNPSPRPKLLTTRRSSYKEDTRRSTGGTAADHDDNHTVTDIARDRDSRRRFTVAIGVPDSDTGKSKGTAQYYVERFTSKTKSKTKPAKSVSMPPRPRPSRDSDAECEGEAEAEGEGIARFLKPPIPPTLDNVESTYAYTNGHDNNNKQAVAPRRVPVQTAAAGLASASLELPVQVALSVSPTDSVFFRDEGMPMAMPRSMKDFDILTVPMRNVVDESSTLMDTDSYYTDGYVKKPSIENESDFYDDSDESDERFTILDIIGNLLSIVMYLVDVGSDIYLAYLYYHAGPRWLFVSTLSFVVIPAMVITPFSLVSYIIDHRNNKARHAEVATPCKWLSRFLFLFFQCGIVLRYIDVLIYGCRSRRGATSQRRWYREMLFEEVDSAGLRMFECFLEAAPQLTLQLYVMVAIGMNDGPFFNAVRSVTCVTSLCSLAWSLASYHRALRLTSPDVARLSKTGCAFHFVWHVFTIGARILALSLFMAFEPLFCAILVGAHWCVMLTWLVTQHTRYFGVGHRCKELWFKAIMAGVYTFAFVNVSAGHTRVRYATFYATVFVENAAMMLTWYACSVDAWYTAPAMAAVFVGFPAGVGVQATYYLWWHPNNYPPWAATRSIPLFREPERWMPHVCLQRYTAASARVVVL